MTTIDSLIEMELPNNFVHLVGEVKRDSEARSVRQNLNIIDFCLSVPSLDSGDTVYVDCYAYGDVVDEQLEGFVSAGETLEVFGRLTFRSWTDGNGIHRSGKVVVVDTVLSD